MEKKLRITLIKSKIGRLPKHRATLCALRLNRIGQSVTYVESPLVLGMINQVRYLLSVQSIEA